jgi:hypothetical protein
MGIAVIPAPSAASKTMFRTTLTSGTSYTVPAGVTYLNVTLYGGGGGGTGFSTDSASPSGTGGTTTFTGATSATGGIGTLNMYSNGQGDGTSAQANSAQGGMGFTRTDSGAGRIVGTKGADGSVISSTLSVTPGASIAYGIGAGGGSTANSVNGGTGGSGKIDVEYWA